MHKVRRSTPAKGTERVRTGDEPAPICAADLEQVRELCLQLFQLAPVGYLTHDLAGRILEANYTVGALLGLSAESLRDENLKRFVAREDAPSLAAHLSRVGFEKVRCGIELRMLRADGTRFFAALESVPLERADGGGTTILSSVLDVTRHKQTQARSLERQATAEAILAASNEAIVGVDEQGAIRTFNGAAERLFGHRGDEVIGRHVGLLFDVAGPPVRSSTRESAARSARAVRSDGSSFDAEVRVGRVAGASYTVLSVVDHARRDRPRAPDEPQALEQAARLARSVAHDVNNLLMSIANGATRIADVADDPAAVHARVAELQRAALGGAAIVRRLTRMMGRADPIDVGIDAALESVSDALRPMLPDGVALALDLAAPDASVSLHPGRLEQLVFNLVVNAEQAMADGGTITVSTRRVASPPRVRITVEDTGAGMDEPTQARLFDPYFTTKPSGTGLGLVTVQGIVDDARGHITVQSELGAGTRFCIDLPEVARGEDGERPTSRARPATMLLVESDTLVRSTLRAYLERRGHHVIEAADAGEALERCRSEARIDVLLSACTLADGLGGLDLATRVREVHPGTPVLLVCDPAQVHVVRGGRLAPGVFLLRYPCSERELIDALVQVLGPAPTPERSDRASVLLVEDDALNRRMLGELLRKRGYSVQLASTVAQALARHRAGPSATDVVVADAHLPDGTLLDLVAGVRSGDHDPALVVLSGLGPADDPAIAAALAQPRTAFARKPCGVDEIALCIERVRTARPRSSPPSA